MTNKTKLGLDVVLKEIKAGLSPAKICKKYKIPKQTLSYSIGKLKELDCIKKVGYAVWEYIKEVPEVPKDTITSQNGTYQGKKIRGHAFIWKIRFLEEIQWKKRLDSSKIKYQLICSNRVFRILYQDRKIWLTRKGLIIYEPIDFLGKSSFQVKGSAVFVMDRLIKSLLNKINQKFIAYQFTTSREHYAMIKNELARQYNDKKEKLLIKNQEGTTWLWIDDSKGLNELETNEPMLSKKVQDWYNSHKKTNFEVTPEFVMGAINQNAQNHRMYAENLKAHVQSVKDLGTGVNKQNKLFERIASVLEKLEK